MRILAFLVAACGAVPQDRPNIVFVLVDDLRYDALGCAGHPFVKTPNIDRLAREGARFKNAFVTTPLCSPSRGSFLTGRYVRAHGVKGNGDNNALSHQLATFPRLLHDAGYETAYFGKWHMGNDDMPRPGIDRWVSFKGQGAHIDPTLNIDGKAGKVQGYMTDLLTDYAVEFVKRKHEKPFCIYLAHKSVHGPFTPAERHKGLFADQAIARAPSAQDTLEGKPALTRDGKGGGAGGSGDELIRNQMRMLLSVDEGLGKILQALEETRALDSTVVVFTSDNGYLWSEHKLGDKRAAYEESIRIPLLVRYPALAKAGSTPEAAALNVDIAPTFLDLAGVAVPKNMHGRSLVPVLKGDTAEWRKSFLAEYFMEKNVARIPTWVAVRGERWKYIRYTGLEGMDELYDLRSDPYEMKNLASDAGSQEALKEMKNELERREKEIK